jgi:hypothetical protein
VLYISEGGFFFLLFFSIGIVEKKKKSTRNLMNGFACHGFSEFGSKHFGGSGPIHHPKMKKSHK